MNTYTYVIGDVHGCYYSLMAILDRIGPSIEDHLIFLGDLINKGPYSKLVVDELINLRGQGYKIDLIRGNHEYRLMEMIGNISDREIQNFKTVYTAQKSYTEFFDKNFEMPLDYQHFFSSMKPYIKKQGYLLIHAGLNFKLADPFEDEYAMMMIRDWYANYDGSKVDNHCIVHGHQNSFLSESTRYLQDSESKTIPLDTGCVYYGEKEGLGYLSAMRLEDRQHFVQVNIEAF
jgi:serine/threonine protein phosphatase 1